MLDSNKPCPGINLSKANRIVVVFDNVTFLTVFEPDEGSPLNEAGVCIQIIDELVSVRNVPYIEGRIHLSRRSHPIFITWRTIFKN